MAALQISLYPQCTDSKECLGSVSPHAGRRSERTREERMLPGFPSRSGAVKAMSVLQPALTRLTEPAAPLESGLSSLDSRPCP